MTKLQAPCVVCKTPIYISANVSRETTLCAPCKRQGVAPKKKVKRCLKCREEITSSNTSARSTQCLACYAKSIAAELERAKVELEKEKRRAVVVINGRGDDMTFPDTVVFGNFPWQHANTNPVG